MDSDETGAGSAVIARRDDSNDDDAGILNPARGSSTTARTRRQGSRGRIHPGKADSGSMTFEDKPHKPVKRIRRKKSREFRDEWTYTRDGLVWLLLPIGGLFAWVIYLVVSLTQLTSVTLTILERTSITERLSLRVLEHSRVMSALVEGQSNTTRAQLARELLEVEEGVQYAVNLVVLGGYVVDDVAGESFTLGPLSFETEEGKLFLDDGCRWIEEGTPMHDECRTIDGGALNNGIYRVV